MSTFTLITNYQGCLHNSVGGSADANGMGRVCLERVSRILLMIAPLSLRVSSTFPIQSIVVWTTDITRKLSIMDGE